MNIQKEEQRERRNTKTIQNNSNNHHNDNFVPVELDFQKLFPGFHHIININASEGAARLDELA